MSRFANKIFLLSLFLFSSGSSKNYYINSLNGSDANSGLHPNSPWKSIERINNHEFMPGDSLLFKSGMKWRGELNIKWSGTEEQPIIISNYGIGNKPKIIGSEIAADWQRFEGNIWKCEFYNKPGCIWILKDGQIIWGRERESIFDLMNVHDFFWKENFLYAVFNEPISGDFLVEASVRDFGIISGWYGSKGDYINIENIDIHFTKIANIRAVGTKGWKISSSDLHHSGNNNESDGQGIQYEGSGSEFSGNLIYENGQHGIFISAFGNAEVKDILIERNTLYNNYHTGIDLMNDGGGENSLQKIIVRKNRIYDLKNFIGKEIGIQTLGYGTGKVRQITIHHNLLFNIKGIGISIMQNSDSIFVHNNTVLNTESACISINNHDLYTEVINNAVQNHEYYASGFLHSKTNKFVDHNIWSSPDTNITKNIYVNEKYFSDLKSYRMYSGFDMNGSFLNPSVVWENDIPVNTSETSVCIDKGIKLGYRSDIYGNVIKNEPDIGAFEFND